MVTHSFEDCQRVVCAKKGGLDAQIQTEKAETQEESYEKGYMECEKAHLREKNEMVIELKAIQEEMLQYAKHGEEINELEREKVIMFEEKVQLIHELAEKG